LQVLVLDEIACWSYASSQPFPTAVFITAAAMHACLQVLVQIDGWACASGQPIAFADSCTHNSCCTTCLQVLVLDEADRLRVLVLGMGSAYPLSRLLLNACSVVSDCCATRTGPGRLAAGHGLQAGQ
jgi:hypothetical protein